MSQDNGSALGVLQQINNTNIINKTRVNTETDRGSFPAFYKAPTLPLPQY